MPWSRVPISASPESFSRMRRNTGAPSDACTAACSDRTVIPAPAPAKPVPPLPHGLRLAYACSSGEHEELELEHLAAGFLQRLADGLRGVVDPLLVDEDVRAEEALVQHALDDLLARLLRLRLHLVRVGEDLALARHDLFRHVVAADPTRPHRHDVHRDLATEIVAAAAHLQHRAELVRRRMGIRVDLRAVDGLESRPADDDDVLAELRRERDPLVLELGLRADALRLDEVEHLLRVREELVAVRNEVGLAADRDHRPLRAVICDAVADLALGRGTVGALCGLRHASLAQQHGRGFHVAVRLLQRALAVHHSGARLVAKLLDERCRDLRHHSATSGSAPGSGSGSAAAAGSGSATASGAGAVPFSGFANSFTDTFFWPSSIAFAITFVISAHERIASSFPGTT